MDTSNDNKASLSGKIVVLELSTKTTFAAKAETRQKLIKAGANVSMIIRRDAACFIASKDIINDGGYKISEAKKMAIPIICVDEIDQLIRDPSKYLVNSPLNSSNGGSKPQHGTQSPLVAKPEAAWNPSPLPIDLSELVPQISLKYSTDNLPKPSVTEPATDAASAARSPAGSDEDFWSFPTANPIELTPAPEPSLSWRPPQHENSSLPLDLNALVPDFSPASKPPSKPPKTAWKTRSTFNLAKAQSNASDLALLDVQNRMLALLNVENRSLVVVEHVQTNDDDDDDDHSRRRRLKFVDPDLTYCDVAKMPIPPPPKMSQRILPKESLLEPPESQNSRRRFLGRFKRGYSRSSHASASSDPTMRFSDVESDMIRFVDNGSSIESW